MKIQNLERQANTKYTQENLKNLYEVRKNLQQDNTLKLLDIELKKAGVQPSDSMFARMASRVAGDTGFLDYIKNQLKTFKTKFK